MQAAEDPKAHGMTLLLFGCIPFAAGAGLAVVSGTDKLPVSCPFRLMTGLPCPLCGGTRAFTYAASGNSKFLSYNGFWVFVAIALIVMGLLVLFTRFSVTNFWSRDSRRGLILVVALLAGGWIWALANRGLIVS